MPDGQERQAISAVVMERVQALASRAFLVWAAVFYTLADGFAATTDAGLRFGLSLSIAIVSAAYILGDRWYATVDRRTPGRGP